MSADYQLSNSESNKKIAKNTVLLYTRMILSIFVSLYTSRVVLRVLGVEDYGTYGLVAGIVSMFTFLNAAMSGATSRFLTFEMGKSDSNRLRETFSAAFIVHLCIAIVVILLAETIGLWFLYNKLVIPEGRLDAANIVFQCTIVSMFFSITQVPYNATIIAHEKMSIYAYIDLLGVSLKLGIVFLLLLGDFDRLIEYAILVMCVSILIALIYRFYAIAKYPEAHVNWKINRELVKPMLQFSGWNLLSECGYSFRVQGSNMVLNMFFGTIVNAAGGVAGTVQGIMIGFIGNITTAVRPQIIKNYSIHNLQRMNRLMISSIRLNLLLVVLITVPMMVDTPYVLKLWLQDVPQYSIEFSRLLFFAIFITCVTHIVTIGIHATGNIRTTSLVRSIIYLSTPFVIYFVLKFWYCEPIIGYVIIVINQMIACLIDIYILHRLIPEIEALTIFIDYCKSLVIAFLVVVGMHYMISHFDESFFRLVVDCLIEWVVLFILFYTLMFKNEERYQIKLALNKLRSKISHR